MLCVWYGRQIRHVSSPLARNLPLPADMWQFSTDQVTNAGKVGTYYRRPYHGPSHPPFLKAAFARGFASKHLSSPLVDMSTSHTAAT